MNPNSPRGEVKAVLLGSDFSLPTYQHSLFSFHMEKITALPRESTYLSNHGIG